MARLPSFRRWLVPVAVLLAAVRCGGGDVTLPSDKLPAKITIEAGDAQQGTVAVRLTDTLVVRVTDTKLGPVSTVRVVFQRLAGGTGGAVIPDTAVTDNDGRARSLWVLGRLAGAQSVQVRVIGQVAGAPLSATFRATGVAAAPDTIFAALGDRQTGAVGSTLADSLAVLVTDQYANPVAGQSVTWSVPAGQGSVSASSVTTGSDGRAAVQRRLGPTTGTQTATATLAGVKGSPVTFTSTATAGGAVRAVKLFGDLQTAPAGFQLTDSVVVQVQDANGNGVPNRNVNWVVTDGGSVTPLTSTTDAQGKAFAYWTLKPTAGANQLTAAASGLAQLQFSATGTSATPSQIVAQSGTTIAGTAGLGVTQKPSVKVSDANSNPVQGVTVTFQVTAGGGTVADPNGSGSSVSVATGANGIATLTAWTLGTVAGAPNTVTATASGAGISGNPVTFNATAAAGAAARLLVSTQPSAGAQSGAVLAQQPVLQLQDAFGNAVSQPNVQVTAALIGTGAVVRGSATVSTSASGAANFSGLNLFGAAGAYSLGFSAGGLAGDTSSVIALTAGAPAKLVITTQPAASAQSGVPFATQPVLQVQDSAGNPVSAAGFQVAATIATGGGTLGGTTPVATVANGSASFTDLSITGAAGPRTLSFSATGLAAAVSGTVTLGAGVPTTLAIVTQPSASAQSGSVFAQQPVLALHDATGNTVPQAGVSVTVAITGAPAGVSLGGNPTVLTTAGGTASFAGLSLSGPAGNYTLSFTVTGGAIGVAGVTSSAIALAAGSGTALTITVQPPATGQSGVALAPAPVIQLRDGVGNAVNQSGVAVIASIASGASGTLTGTDTALTNASGAATFGNLVISGAVGSYTLAFNGAGLTGVTATPTVISAGPAAKLALLTQPSATAQSGIMFGTQPVLQLEDAAGNPVSQAGIVVTAAIASGGGTLGGTLTATTGVGGQAGYTDLTITGTVGPRTLGFTAPALSGVTSGSIALTAGAEAAIAKVAGDGQSATAGSPLPIDPQVKVTDASGNPVSGVAVSFTVTGGGGSVGAAQPTDVNGLASATWTLGPSSGANTLDATATLAGGPTSVSFSATGTAGTAGQLAITTQPSATAASGAVFAQQPEIQLQDQNGNNVSTSGVAITANSSGNLGGNVTVATVNGVASFSNLSLTDLVGSYTLTFTGTNLTGVTSNPISLTPGQPVGLVVVTQPGATEQSGIAFVQQPVVQVVDAAGNAVPTAGRQVTAAINTGPGGTINPVGRQVTTNASGTATFTTLTLTGPVGSYTLLFSSAGLAAAQSGGFTLAAGTATQISANSVTTQSATVGTAVGTPPSVLVVDGVGNPVAGVAVNFAVTAGGGSLNGASQTTDSTGVATVTSWTLGASAGGNTVTATATGLTGSPVSFNATGVAGGATTIALNAGNNQSATVGTAVAIAPSVKVTDANSNPVANVSVSFAVASGGGSVTLGSATSNGAGIATVGSWSLGQIAGPNTLTATSGTLIGSPVTFTATGTAAAAATIAISAGDGQTATIGTSVGIPPQVLVSDGFGNPKSGVNVTFAVASGGGSVVPTSAVVTNASGLATVTSWTLGTSAGTNTLTATAVGLSGSPLTFSATATAGGATKIALNAGNNQSATVGTAVSTAPSVLVTDAGNNPVANVTVTFAAASGGGSVIGGATTSNASGIATVGSWTLGTTAGSNTLTATSTGLTGSPVTFTATGTAGAPATLLLNTGDNQSATVNTAVSIAPSVKVIDGFSNPVANVGVLFAVATGGGSVTLASPTTNGAGIATVGSWTLGTTAGSNTLTATSGSLAGSPVTFTATGAAGAAATIAISAGDGQTATVGTAVAIAPQVLVTDAFGNPKSGTGVTFAVASGGGVVVPTSAISTNSAGHAAVTSWTLGATAGTNTLTATSAGLAGSPLSFTATGQTGGATKLAVTTAPSSTAQSGIPLVTQPVLQLQDAGGNPVAQANVTVTAVLFAGTRTLSNATALTNIAGQASFSGLTIAGLIGTDSISFAAPSLTGTARTAIVITAGTATKLGVNRQPSTTGQSGVALAVQPRAQVQDSVGNSVSQALTVVTASIASGPVGAVLVNPTATTASTGLATFSGLAISGPVGVYTLQFDATGLTAAVSGNVTISAGPASQLSFTTQTPPNASSGVAFSPPPVLQLRDGAGNAVVTAGIAISASIASGPGGGALTNAVATTNSSGAATFTGLALTGTAGSYTLSFSGTGLTPVTSATIALGAGGGSQLGITTQPSSSVPNGQAFPQQPVIQLEDGTGNPVSLAGVSVGVTLQSGSGTLSGTTAVLTNSNGQAVFTNLTITGTTGIRTLLFAASGYVSVTSGNVDVTAGAPSTVTMVTQPSTSAQNTVAFATQPVAVVRDQSNNLVPGTGVTASIATGAGTLGGTLTVFTDGAGVATFGTLEITGVTGSRTLRLTAGSASTTTNAISITAGPASGAQSTGSVPGGTVGQVTNISVQAKDVSGNLVTVGGASVVISVSGNNSAVPAVTDNGNGTYSASYTPTAAGSDNVAISLNGSPVSGSPFASTVAAGSSSTTISSVSAGSTVVGQSYTVNFSVTGAGVTPTGTVTVSDGAQSCFGSLLTGAGSCQITSTSAGAKTLVATYGGDANYSGSASAGVAHTVTAATTTASITSDSPDPSTVGSAYTVSFTVVAVAPGSGTPTGNVTVSDGTDGCTGTVAAGSCALTSTTAGVKTLTASYAGSTNFAASISAGVGHTVGSATTTTSIVSHTPNPSVTGQGILVSYSVTSSGGTPTGSVTVSDGSDSCSSSVASGSCTLVVTSTGTKTLTATYAGDGNFGGSTSVGVTQTVNQAATTTAITSDTPDPSTVGSAYTVSFTVVAAAPGSGTPTGNVTVSDGTDNCTGTVAAGSCALTSTATGAKTLTATYAGDADYTTSSGTAAHTVGLNSTTTTISSSSANPSVTGQTVTIGVSVASAVGTPSGTVNVTDGAISCNATLSGGTGSCNLTFTSAGARSLTASYGGDTGHSGSSSATFAQAVNAAATTTAITGDTPDPSTVGSAYTVSFTVTATAPGSGTPTGNVTVSDGLDTCTGTVAAGSCALTSTTTGAKTLTASYVGSANFAASGSAGAPHTVSTAATTTAITAHNPDPSVIGQQVDVSVDVSSAFGTPAGSVTVSDGTEGCTIAALSGGSGSCSFTPTTAGAKTLTASYGGDATHAGSSGTAAHQVDPFGAAAALQFLVQPSDVLAGGTITPAVQVRILDAFGNLVANATDAVTIAIANDPNLGTSVLTGTIPVNAVGGVASFSDLSIDLTGVGFTLSAGSGVLAGATSAAFDVQ